MAKNTYKIKATGKPHVEKIEIVIASLEAMINLAKLVSASGHAVAFHAKYVNDDRKRMYCEIEVEGDLELVQHIDGYLTKVLNIE